MASTTFTASADVRIASPNLGAGASLYLPVGLYGGYLYRSLVKFSGSFSGMVTITNAVVNFKTSNQFYVAFGSDPDVEIRRVTTSWNQGGYVSLSSSNTTTWANRPSVTGTNLATADVSTSENTWDSKNITGIMQDALAAGVFYGLEFRAVNETSATDVTEFRSTEYGSGEMYIDITYTTNTVPSSPTGLSPTGYALGTPTPTIAFNHIDSDGDALLDYDLQVSTDPSFASVTHWNISAQTTGITGDAVSRVYAGTALTRGFGYYWRARTSSATGLTGEGAWTSAQLFKVNSLPVPTFVTPSATDALVEMAYTAGSGANPRMVIRWSSTDADAGDTQSSYQVVVVTDADAAFWDSGKVASAVTNVTVPVDPTRAAFYKVTLTVWDSIDEGASTSQRRMKAQWTVAEYKINLGSVVTSWNTLPASTGGTNKRVVVEYASSTTGSAISTWYASLSSAALDQWFHWRVFLFAWSGASTPSMTKMEIQYTSAAAVLPDGWTTTAQHALDSNTKVYGTKSLKVTCNTTTLRAYQEIAVEANTDYIISGRIKSDGNTGAMIDLASGPSGPQYVETDIITATTDWTRVKSNVWNSGANSSVWVRCVAIGVGGTFAWFDAIKMEASTVATPWTPGFVSSGLILDVGGIQIDGANAVFRLRGSTGGADDTVDLSGRGLTFGDVEVYGDGAGNLVVGGGIENNGLINLGAGSSFPSPVTNGHYFRTDLGMDFKYAAGQWVCSCLHTMSGGSLDGSTSTAQSNHQWLAIPAIDGGSIYIEQVDFAVRRTTGTLNGSNYYDLSLWSAVSASTTLTERAALAVNNATTWPVDTHVRSTVSVGTAVSDVAFRIGIAKTGAPPATYYGVAVTYRYIAT